VRYSGRGDRPSGAREWIVKIPPASSSTQTIGEIARVYGGVLVADEKQRAGLRTCRRLVSDFGGSPALSSNDAAKADTEELAHIDGFGPVERAKTPTQSREIFPLDRSQRQVVRHACRLAEGEILAVNGPPGTGKTAMLRAVIASCWVRAAVIGDHPPIIVGCGATNQAVPNITEAFIDAGHGLKNDYPVAERWNPFVGSYGMFFASGTYAGEHPDKAKKYQAFR
jgi:hypothetical protein